MTQTANLLSIYVDNSREIYLVTESLVNSLPKNLTSTPNVSGYCLTTGVHRICGRLTPFASVSQSATAWNWEKQPPSFFDLLTHLHPKGRAI